ncbi:unnamed protein product [Ectocarpus sp. 12 AP-2014]
MYACSRPTGRSCHIHRDNQVTSEKASASAGKNRGRNRGPRRRPATEKKEACVVALHASKFFRCRYRTHDRTGQRRRNPPTKPQVSGIDMTQIRRCNMYV